MNYSLSNMLSNSGVLNADKLSLDLAFALDKTLVARKGPTPAFTRASTATFINNNGLIQSAAIDIPRFDHNPVTLVCNGLRIEEQRTNLAIRSQEYNNSAWLKTNSTVNVDVTTSPSNVLDADKIIPSALNSAHGIFQVISVPSAPITASVFVKAAGYNFATICVVGGNNSRHAIVVNLTTGAITKSQSANNPTDVSSSTSLFLNGWLRISVTLTSVSGPGFITIGASPTGSVVLDANLNPNFAGDGTSGIFIWGGQLETGGFPTSYIPTTAASVTRSADVCTITGTDFTSFYNQSEGTISVNASTPASGDRTVIGIDDNSSNEMIRIRTEGTDPFYKVTDGGSDVVALDIGTVIATTPFRIAATYKINNFAASLNGAVVSTDNVGTIPTVDRLRIGQGQAGNVTNGHISRIQYFGKRLANEKLQTLTT